MEAVRFDHVSKRFTIQHERARTFQEAALQLVRQRPAGAAEEFWALRDVSFTVGRGRTLGIVGRNGSGKSTLLKLLAGTMKPTDGQIATNGKVFGLLELAAGFHPELSGRENVFLNGAFLGLSRDEMAGRLDQIVSFAELEQFIDTPVKHYSSGMYMRLGFAIAISVDPDILVIDEVLAVGDAAFRQKCFLALAEFKQRQKTIMFVTHDSAAVRRFCDDAIWLDHGLVRGAGPAGDVLDEYLAAIEPAHGSALAFDGRPKDPLATPSGPLEVLAVETVDERGHAERHFQSGQRAGIRVRLRAEQPLDGVSVGVALHRADGLYLFGTSTKAVGQSAHAPPGEASVVCWLGALPLPAAEYTVSAAAWLGAQPDPAHRLAQAAHFAVRPPRADQAGALVLSAAWQPEGGVAFTPVVATVAERQAVPFGAGQAASDVLPAGQDGHDGAMDVAPLPGFVPGRPDDQSSPVDGFYARWRRAPGRIVMGAGEDEFLGSGWYPPEDWPPCVRWTTNRAVIYLTQEDWASTVVITMCRPQHGERPVEGRVTVGGHVAGAFALASPALEPFSFPLQAVETAREIEVAIEVEELLDPAGEASDDKRTLGVAVHAVSLE
jgi:lipopolysaccharide transport system ATP-binding protein